MLKITNIIKSFDKNKAENIRRKTVPFVNFGEIVYKYKTGGQSGQTAIQNLMKNIYWKILENLQKTTKKQKEKRPYHHSIIIYPFTSEITVITHEECKFKSIF